jgi:hypothetical protein
MVSSWVRRSRALITENGQRKTTSVGVGGLEPKKARRSKQPGHHTSLTTPNVI